jgi:hypothetical protein
MVRGRWVVGILVLGACVQPAPVPEECPQAFANARPYDPGYVEDLAGTYEIRIVPTSYGTTRAVSRAGLLLAVPDTLRRYYPEHFRGSHALLGQRLAGMWRHPGATITEALDEVSIEGGVLYIGCRQCLDASPDHFQIEHVSPIGSWGHWENPLTGLWVIVDSAGRQLPKPSGFYCAIRVDNAIGFRTEWASLRGGA